VTAEGLTAQAVAELVGGRLLGDGAVTLRSIRPLDRAGPEALSFAISTRYAEELRASHAGAVLIPDALADAEPGPRTRIVVRDPYAALTRVMGVLFPSPPAAPGVDPTAMPGGGGCLPG
jgi:UDP-3-O-[3-hydroxymyristoyl] glucosamine N-acyltransferase